MSNLVLCIGAPRSGTTWLYSNIRKSENIYAPCIKEVRYFVGARSSDGVRSTYENRIETHDSLEDRVFLEKWLDLKMGDDQAYLDAMFNSSKKPISIDISPIYCTANSRQVKKIKEVVGAETKILYFLRNPVDREYSQANLHFHMHGTWKKETAPLSNYLELLQEKSQVRRSDYLGVLESWTQSFGKDNIHTVFYDDLRDNPSQTLEQIFKFIGVEENKLESDPGVEEKVGSSFGAAHIRAPRELKKYLAASNLKNLHELSNYFPEPCKEWYDQAVDLVNNDNTDI